MRKDKPLAEVITKKNPHPYQSASASPDGFLIRVMDQDSMWTMRAEVIPYNELLLRDSKPEPHQRACVYSTASWPLTAS